MLFVYDMIVGIENSKKVKLLELTHFSRSLNTSLKVFKALKLSLLMYKQQLENEV